MEPFSLQFEVTLPMLFSFVYLPILSASESHMQWPRSAAADHREFNYWHNEIRLNWRCNAPRPQLVYLTDEHPSQVATEFIWDPPAALLHRCGDSTGCCRTYPIENCVAVESEIAQVTFQKRIPSLQKSFLLRFNFQNHTRCGCRPS